MHLAECREAFSDEDDMDRNRIQTVTFTER